MYFYPPSPVWPIIPLVFITLITFDIWVWNVILNQMKVVFINNTMSQKITLLLHHSENTANLLHQYFFETPSNYISLLPWIVLTCYLTLNCHLRFVYTFSSLVRIFWIVCNWHALLCMLQFRKWSTQVVTKLLTSSHSDVQSIDFIHHYEIVANKISDDLLLVI